MGIDMLTLKNVSIGSRFRSGRIVARLIRRTSCSAVVEIERGPRVVRIEGIDGRIREFTAHEKTTQHWSTSAEIDEVL